MKIKKDKALEKHDYDEESNEQQKGAKKMGRKFKEEQKETENDNDGTAVSETIPATEKSLKSVDVNIFKFFKELTSEEEKTRMEAALHLLQQIQRTKETEKRQKELIYCLKRLIRGCGASTNVSRAGFFTGLVGLFKTFDSKEVPMTQIFETLNKELNVGAAVANKEDADAIVGKILVCGAILHSGRLIDVSSEDLEQITNILLLAARHRTYHASLGYGFLCELIETLPQEQFEASVWPLVQQELLKPWPKQTLQSVYCLISVQKKFPDVVNAKFLKRNFGGKQLLNPESFQHLHKIFWQHSNTDILTHPALECFGSHIASGKYLAQFWREVVDPGLKNPTKLLEVETLKILTDILDNLNVEKTSIHELLTDNFMQMFIEGLKNLRQKNDETLKAFYADFFESLVKCCGKLNSDANKVAVIKRLILPPGIFNIEKFTGHRIVHQLINTLFEEGVKEVFDLYKSIFLATLVKNPGNLAENWLNFERLNAGYMLQNLLQHKAVKSAYQWREEQLKFLFSCGIFHVTDTAEICKKEAAGAFSKDFAEQCKNMFFTCLQSKLIDIEKEQQLLFNLAEFCQEKMLKKNANKYFRLQKFNDSQKKSWTNMFESVEQSAKSEEKIHKKNKAGNKLQTVFNILLLNMGLQLFREPEMAGPAIEDLLKCLEKTKQQKKLKKKSIETKDEASMAQEKVEEEEPEWIEVVIELFLHLLSQNNNALRNIVNALFPHLSDNLSLNAVHQILSMLDMKDGNNPLSTKNEDEEEDEGEEDGEGDDEYEKIGPKINGKEESGEESNEDDDNDDDDEEEESDDEEEDEDDDGEGVTASDKLRNAISQALIANGTAANADDDMESVDLNEITEEEGRKLDEALANAFKALKKTSGSSSQNKKSKSYRVKTTTVMHFRIRVLDLIELYLQQNPSLLISIEIMLALFNMLEFCVGDELKPLQSKVEKVLCKLTSHKNYTSEDVDIKEKSFVDFLRLIVEKKAPANVYEIVNKMRNKCFCFLIVNVNKIYSDNKAEKVLKLCQEYTQDFIKSRNPLINITLITDIFKLRWLKNWNLAEDLAQQGLNEQTRTFRRIQIYEILTQLYKNHELQKLDEDLCKKYLKKIEKSLNQHIKNLSENNSCKHSPKEFQTLLDLLLTAHKTHQRLQFETVLNSESTLNSLQNLRKLIRLDSPQIYQRFCNTFKLQVIRKRDLSSTTTNKHNDSESESKSDGEDNKETESNSKSESNSQKRKLTSKDLRKLKKQKKRQRLEAASRGLNGGIGFTQRNGASSKAEVSVADDAESDEDSD